ncbi:MAG: NAD-dependent epimerase/dehydratase family protein [Caulobacteraceae bacterium]
MRLLLTGAAGFIGFHLARRLLADGHRIVGVDGLTDYYGVGLKRDRLAILEAREGFAFAEVMLEDMAELERAAADAAPEAIVHLAAQAGVSYSIEAPRRYAEANLTGTFNVMEIARQAKVGHFLLASTSSVYGANTAMPFSEADKADYPLSFYAATKKAGEAMSHAYAHLWGLPTTALRFFTVYGPWGRPDMAPFKFVEAIRAGTPIDVNNRGAMSRDFTFIDDLIEGLVRLIASPPRAGEPVAGAADSLSPVGPWRVVNIGAGAPTDLLAFIETIERAVGRTIERNWRPMPAGEVERTFADCSLLQALTGYRPATGIAEGVAALVDWHRDYYPRGAGAR